MIKILLFSIPVFFYLSGYGQNDCGIQIKDPTDLTFVPNFDTANSYYCINVRFHIVRNTNGTAAFVEPNINDMLQVLNEGFNQNAIFFNNIGTNFVNNGNYIDITSFEEFNQLGNVDNNSSAINVYIVENLSDNGDGFAGIANIGSNYMSVTNNSATTNTTIHEMGHLSICITPMKLLDSVPKI